MTTRDALKREVGAQAAALVEDGMVVGLGTGSTAACFIDSLAARVAAGLRIVAIPTSERSARQAHDAGIALTDLATHGSIDLAIDGADEITRQGLDLIKGLGGALLREKIVASAARRLVIIADDEKLVTRLGERCAVPVEVVVFGWQRTRERLRALGTEATLRTGPDGAPYVTDGGNHILDCTVPQDADIPMLAAAMRDLVGVVETGFFLGMTEAALIAGADGVTRIAA